MQPTPFDIDAFDDGFVEEPPAPEPPSSISPQPAARGPSRAERIIRQVGHRAAIAATIVLVAAVGAILMRQGMYWTMLLIAFLGADLGLLCGVLASWRQRRREIRDREPLGLILYSLMILIPTLLLVVMAKQERLDGLITAVMSQ
jgi:hypothetical protein